MVIAAHRRGRNVTGQVSYVIALLVSCGLSGAAAAIRATTQVNVDLKIGLLYTGIVIEILSTAVQNHLQFHPSSELSERYGALSLIIMLVTSLKAMLTRQR